jgi:hypothetical protein
VTQKKRFFSPVNPKSFLIRPPPGSGKQLTNCPPCKPTSLSLRANPIQPGNLVVDQQQYVTFVKRGPFSQCNINLEPILQLRVTTPPVAYLVLFENKNVVFFFEKTL